MTNFDISLHRKYLTVLIVDLHYYFCYRGGFGLWWQQEEQGIPDDPEVFPGDMRCAKMFYPSIRSETYLTDDYEAPTPDSWLLLPWRRCSSGCQSSSPWRPGPDTLSRTCGEESPRTLSVTSLGMLGRFGHNGKYRI